MVSPVNKEVQKTESGGLYAKLFLPPFASAGFVKKGLLFLSFPAILFLFFFLRLHVLEIYRDNLQVSPTLPYDVVVLD